MSRLHPAAVSIAIALSCSVAAGSAGSPQQGSWRPFPVDRVQRRPNSPAWVTPAMVKEFGTHLVEIAEVFKRTPFLAAPQGWVMFQHPDVHSAEEWSHPRGDRHWPISGALQLRASNFEPDGRTVYDTGTAFVINIGVNDLSCALDNNGPWAEDAAGTMFREVETPAESEHGFPAYQQCLLITHRTEPMFVPVTLERVIRVRIAAIQKRVTELKSVMDTSASEAIAKQLETMLAGLGAPDRRGAAFAQGGLLDNPLSFREGRRVVEANPAFFDAARPSDVQLLTLFVDCMREGCTSRPAIDNIIRQLDWKAVDALVR
ncbi:MAG TPA: hypothetical protein VN700_19760 [Vicinamibacterales bacterium]|nr:hypothetical protein [Vicinamibacterales bacterium]